MCECVCVCKYQNVTKSRYLHRINTISNDKMTWTKNVHKKVRTKTIYCAGQN